MVKEVMKARNESEARASAIPLVVSGWLPPIRAHSGHRRIAGRTR